MRSITDVLKDVSQAISNQSKDSSYANVSEVLIQLKSEVDAFSAEFTNNKIGTRGVEDIHATEDTRTEVVVDLDPIVPNEYERMRLENIHDLLVKGWGEEATRYVRSLIDADPNLGYQSGALAYLKAFEKSFFTACRKQNVLAAYMVLEQLKQPDNTVKYKMITGGNHLAETVLSYYLRPVADAAGQDINPPKPFLEPGWVERTVTWSQEELNKGS